MAHVKVGEENSNDINIYFEDHGRGQPVVLIHGYPLSGTSWEKQEAVLLNAGFRVITYDRRGFGRSSKPSIDYNYEAFTEDLSTLMNHLDLRDAILVGFSMGSGEVVRYLARHGTGRVSRAVLMGPIPPFLMKTNDNPEGLDVSVFQGFQKEILKDRPAFLRQFLETFFNYDVLKGERISEHALEAHFLVANTASAKATHDCVSTWLTDFREDLKNLNLPLLIMHGDADRILPYDLTAKRLATLLPEAKVVTIKEGPHAIGWTHAEEVNAELLEFIGGEKTFSQRTIDREAGLGLS